MPHKEPQTRRLDDEDAEAVRVSHHVAIRTLQTMPAATLKPILNVVLPPETSVSIPHGLGRAPVMHWVSTVRGDVVKTPGPPTVNGFIEEIRDGVDRSLYIVLKARSFGVPVAVDVAVI